MADNQYLEKESQSCEETIGEEKFKDSSSHSDQHIGDLEIGRVRSRSPSSASTTDSFRSPTLAHALTSNSVPASVMTHSQSGADLERRPTGPKNKTVDEEGKIVVNWMSRSDPENPKNWSRKKKIFNVVIISAMTFLCLVLCL